MRIHSDLTTVVGNTPLVAVDRFAKASGVSARLAVKLEKQNPAGSAKDRVGLAMIDDAEKKGLLKPHSVIIEPTSGNTGIGLAMVGAIRGYRVILTMPETMSIERRKLLAAYGAELVLTDGKKGMAGAIEKAKELASVIPDSWIPGQFENPSNAKAHYCTTGPEIWSDTDGTVEMFVAGIGTGGTITGVGRYLKEQNPQAFIVGAEPVGSPVLTKGESGPHGLQGIGAGFVPEVLDRTVVDKVLTVSEEEAYAAARLLAKTEGILVGISAGAALAAAVRALKETEGTPMTVVLLPDTGERYLSSPLFLSYNSIFCGTDFSLKFQREIKL